MAETDVAKTLVVPPKRDNGDRNDPTNICFAAFVLIVEKEKRKSWGIFYAVDRGSWLRSTASEMARVMKNWESMQTRDAGTLSTKNHSIVKVNTIFQFERRIYTLIIAFQQKSKRVFTMITSSLQQSARTAFAGLRTHYKSSSLSVIPWLGSKTPDTRGKRNMVTLRRRRKTYEKLISPQMGHQIPVQGGMENPFQFSGESLEEYSQKATLSPWTPVPDSVARKIFDLANPMPDDKHVELGSGDGRVNFFAIEAGVQQSIGIDVDEDIVKVANDRLNRIHPKPNLEFIIADLMDPNHSAWNHIQEATILTMYFAKDGLEKIRPLLENALKGKRCRIFCCGYEMPGWDYQMAETVLDIPIHFYDWGNPEVEDAILSDKFIENIPMNRMQAHTMDKFTNKRKSTFKPDVLKGFHPDDLVDFGWDNFETTIEEEKSK